MNVSRDTPDRHDAVLTPAQIKKLAGTAFYRGGIEELAEMFRSTPVETANRYVAQLTEMGEAVALTRLLNAFAYCNCVLDPAVLAASGMVVSDMMCLALIFAHQDERVIPHLLKMVRSEELSLFRRVLFARMAAELTVRHGADDEAVRRILHYLTEVSASSEFESMVKDSLALLNAEKGAVVRFPLLTGGSIDEALPDRPPPTVISTGGTLRRPVARVGRNDPCPCGSGRKYKRCCQSKDSELLADASEYAGITQTQLLENPGIVSDTHLIEGMLAYELKKLDPSRLNGNQLFAAYRRAQHFGLLDVAFTMLCACSEHPELDFDFDPGHFVDILTYALDAGNMEVAERARELISDQSQYADWESIDMQFELHRNPGVLATLEQRCAAALGELANSRSYSPRDHDFCNLAHILRRKFPALSILFARAAVSQRPDRLLDNDLLAEVVCECRVDLELDPWDDPIDAMLCEGERSCREGRELQQHAGVESALRQDLTEAREQARLSAKRLAEAEAAMQELKKALVAREQRKSDSPSAAASPVEPSPEQRETMERLRRQIDNLKVEIGNQQEQRRTLRRQLDQERRSSHRSQERSDFADAEEITEDNDAAVAMPSGNERKVMIPEYREDFRDACRNLPASVAGGAIRAIAGIAAYEESAWQNFRAIKRLRNIYRMRIGIHYRLLLKWLPGETLCALDLIPRKELESWIKRHGA